MANIVGLNSTQDDPSATRRRLDVSIPLADGSNIRAPSLKPVASPVDTYARPTQAPINHDLQNLAEGLASLNPALTAFAKAQGKENKDIDKDALAAKYGGMSSEQISQVLQSGQDPELSNKFAAGFVGNIRASKQGDEDGAWWNNHYNTEFDRQNGNLSGEFDEFVAKRVQTVYGQNSAGANAYMERMAGVKRGLMERFAKDKSDQNDYERQQSTQDGFATIARQAIDTDASPQSVMSSTANFMATNKAVMRLPYKQQTQYLLDAVSPLLNDMDQNPEKRDAIYAAVNAIFTMPRKGEDGVERRLIDAPDGLGDMAKGKLADFEKKRNDLNDKFLTTQTAQWKYNASERPELVDPKKLDEWDKANPGAFKSGEKESILIAREKALDKAAHKSAEENAQRQSQAARADVDAKNYRRFRDGDALVVRDVNVPKKEFFLNGDQEANTRYSADEQRQRMTDLFNDQVEFNKNQKVNSKEMTAEQAETWGQGQELAVYSMNGIVPSKWKDEMQTGANQLTVAAQTASKEMPQGALQAYQRYKLLASRAPNLLSQVADERTRAIFDTAMVADGNETEQLRGAIYYYGNRNDQTDKVAKDAVSKALTQMATDDAGWSGWAKSWFGGEVPENLGALNDDIQNRASYLVQAYKMPAATALKKATESLREHYTLINGWAVTTNDKRLPPNFKAISETYIRDVVSRLGQAELGEGATSHAARDAGLKRLGVQDQRDITLVPLRTGDFQLFDKRNGHPILEAVPVEWKGSSKDGRFLTTDMLQDLAAEDRSKQVVRAVRQGENRLKPLFVIPGTGVGIAKPSTGYQPEEIATINRNIEEQGKPSAKKTRQNAEFVKQVDDYAASQRQPVPPRSPLPNPFKPSIVLKDSKR